MSDDINEEFAEQLDALTDTAMDGFSQVIQKLVDYYVEHFDMDVTVAQNQMLIALSSITGELIACMVDEDNIRDFVTDKVIQNIKFSREQTELEHATAKPSEDDPYGLAGMTPLGKC